MNLRNEYGFEEFMQQCYCSADRDNIDFIGIDLNKGQIYFKAYIGMKTADISKEITESVSPSGFLSHLIEKDIVYRLETVDDTRKTWNGRYDIALYNRNNKNMCWLLNEIKSKADFISPYEEIINHISSMKVAENPDYQYSALYHLGILEKDERIQALKLYFTARYENIPDYHSKNFTYHDKEYLDFLGNCGLDSFSVLKGMACDMLECCGGHLWMAGIDISGNGIGKCKIYLKKMSNIYEYLKTAFNGIYRDKAEQIAIWNSKNPDFAIMGVAIGIDESGIPSLNLYFVLD